jgi:4-amino-4-deoxy-L-arabinose transferase-like glycosyltransferase
VAVVEAPRVRTSLPARRVLAGIVVLAAVLYTVNLGRSGYPMYYAVAVRSMSVSWPAFWSGAFDPAASITVDKLAGAFVPQALSARVFGFHQWSLALPQAIEGVVAVLVTFRAVRRWCGECAALLAAALFATTPIVASMFGHSMEDGALTLCLVLAADAFGVAVTRGSLSRLVLAGVWIGVGFQAKMMQAWLIVPAVFVTYLLLAPVRPRVRAVHVAVAGAVTLAVSLLWMTVLALVPAAHRPFADGTTSGNIFATVFGYNGFDRAGFHVPGALPSGFTDGAGGSWTVLVEGRFATQAGWLYPLALAGLVLGLLRWRSARAGFVFWGLWLLTAVGVLSAITIQHNAYLAVLAPPLAALAAAGAVLVWRERGWVLPAVVLAQAAWTIYLTSRYPDFLPWLTGAAVVVAVVAVSVTRWRPMALAALLVVPVAWGLSVLHPRYAGTSFEAGAGPSGPVGVDLDDDTTDRLTPGRRRLDAYLSQHRDGRTYLAATSSWRIAGQFIVPTGHPYLPLGGFSGAAPYPALAEVQRMVADGELRYFVLGGADGTGADGTEAYAITGWVLSACAVVARAEHGGDQDLTVLRCDKP